MDDSPRETLEPVGIKSFLSKDTPPKILSAQNGHGESTYQSSWGTEGCGSAAQVLLPPPPDTHIIWGHHQPPPAGRKGSPWPSVLGKSEHGGPELPVWSAKASGAVAWWIDVVSLPIFPSFLHTFILSFLPSRYISWEHSSINLPHATFHLWICFLGAQPKTTCWASVHSSKNGLTRIGAQAMYLEWQHF